MNTDREGAFADLPDALVHELLSAADDLGDRVSTQIHQLHAEHTPLRDAARTAELLMARADLDVVREPSVSAVDGSYQIHSLTSLDLCAAAAVGIEGTIREERRVWHQPHHLMWVDALPHNVATTNAVRGVMVGMELSLARAAPHDLVLLDGAFSPLVIYLNQSQGAARTAPPTLSARLRDAWNQTSADLLWALTGDRVVAVPKYTTRNELAATLGRRDIAVDGKTLATALLEPGEFTRPLRVYDEDPPYHVGGLTEEQARDLAEAIRDIHVVFFRPYRWLPAIRLEVPGVQVRNPMRLALVLEGIARQLLSPAVFEPYPLFLADRMVKSLGAGVQVLEQAVSQQVVETAADAEDVMLYIRQHRTEGGRL